MSDLRYFDIHCHPAMKPVGKSFRRKKTRWENSKNPDKKNSLWYRNPPGCFQKLINKILTLTKFTQSDFTTLSRGNVKLISACLYPLEKGFIKTRIGSWFLPSWLVSLVTSLPPKRLRYVSRIKSYFADLEHEAKYYEDLNLTVPDSMTDKYMLIGNKSEFNECMAAGDNVIGVVFSIEGANAFDKGLDLKRDTALRETVLGNIRRVKQWDYPPLFISLAHHFYNEICGHARSLPKIARILLNQNREIGEGFTPFGTEVVKRLLDFDKSDNRRILIDIKHMSVKSRNEYFQMIKEHEVNNPNDKIPIIVSHGACNRYKETDDEPNSNKVTSKKMYEKKINLIDHEIVEIAGSGGIFGIQLDERVIASKKELRAARKEARKEGQPHIAWSRLVWNQIEYIAELLDSNDLPAWDTACLGSDFDGIIDPLDAFWTAENLGLLEIGLKNHANDYMKIKGPNLKPENQISSDEIVRKFISDNARDFIYEALP